MHHPLHTSAPDFNGRIYSQVVLTQAGEIDPTHYINAQDGSVFSVDHLTLVSTLVSFVTFCRPHPLTRHSYHTLAPQNTHETSTLASREYEANEAVRGALQNAVNNYISTNYPSEQSAGGAFTKDENTYVVVVTGEKTSLKNFWSGRWTSTWNLAVSGSSASISGDIKVSFYPTFFFLLL